MRLSPKKYSNPALRKCLEQEIASTLSENQQIDTDQPHLITLEASSSSAAQNSE